jgi:type I restriction enzyme S subunit
MTKGPYKLPEGWRWVRLGEVFVLKNGKFIRKNELQQRGSIRVYGSNGLIGYITGTRAVIHHDTIVIGRVGTCGAVNWALAPAWVSDNAMYVASWLIPCEPHYIVLALKRANLGSLSKQGAQPSISQEEVYNALVPHPPLEEQRRIVARIEELMERIREAKRLRRQAKEDAERLWQSALAETFPRPGTEPPPGWRWVRLGEVCEVWDTLRKPVKKKDRIPGNVPYCGANGVIDYVDGHTHAGEFVLLAEDGGFYGPGEPTAYIMSGRFWANNHVHILRGRPDHLVNQLLYYCLVAYDLRPFLTGATRLKLTQGAMRSISIPLPPLDEQRQIVAHLEAVQEKVKALKEVQAATEAELQRLEQAILDRAFRGEL